MTILDSKTIPKFVNQLEKPDVYAPTVIRSRSGRVIRHEYTVNVAMDNVQILPPPFPKTKVLAYGGLVEVPGSIPVFKRSVPGSTFEMKKGIPAVVHWRNEITKPHFLPVDPTVHWANPNNMEHPMPPFLPFPQGYSEAQFSVPHVTHVHGIEVFSGFDGVPEEWFTFNGLTGQNYITNDYYYPNSNQSAAFWYHDHVLGMTRLGVYSGLTGFFIMRDLENRIEFPPPGRPQILPCGRYEIPLVIQDKTFNDDGSLFYPSTPPNPVLAQLHPYWNLMFDGQVNVVNGRVWPNLNVERRQYRFRLLNASNQRFYNLYFSNGMSFIQIGTDGGFKRKPAELTSIFFGVTEREDILVDFSQFEPGTKIQLLNNAQITPPIGPNPDPETDGTVMQFTVVDSPIVPPAKLPGRLNYIARLRPDAPKRILIMDADVQDGEIIQAQLDGQMWSDPVTEMPQVGSTEDWEFVNTTPIDHNKHVHLIQFQIINRQQFDAGRYLADWLAANGDPPFDHPTIKLPVEPYLIGGPLPPPEYEIGWKDSIHAPAGQITRIRIRWAPQELPTGGSEPGVNEFPIDPTKGPGYIWHCHILEHEDNEMMRRLVVVDAPSYSDWFIGEAYDVGDKVRFGPVNYSCIKEHVSDVSLTPEKAPSIWNVILSGPKWQPHIFYHVGDTANFKGNTYECLVEHISEAKMPPPINPEFWKRINPY